MSVNLELELTSSSLTGNPFPAHSLADASWACVKDGCFLRPLYSRTSFWNPLCTSYHLFLEILNTQTTVQIQYIWRMVLLLALCDIESRKIPKPY
jgi:hypothetical protein